MKEEQFLNNLTGIFDEDEASSLMSNNSDIPIHPRIEDMIMQAKNNLNKERNHQEETSPGILDKLSNFLDGSASSPSVAFGIDGKEEEEKQDKNEDDPLKEVIEEDKDSE